MWRVPIRWHIISRRTPAGFSVHLHLHLHSPHERSVYYTPHDFSFLPSYSASPDRGALFAVDLSVRNLIMRARNPGKESPPRADGPRLARALRTPRLFILSLQQNCKPAWCTVTGRFFPSSPGGLLASLKRARGTAARLLINFQFYATPIVRLCCAGLSDFAA